MPANNRRNKVDGQIQQSYHQAIQSACLAHTAVRQAQSSLLSQEIDYAEHRINDALNRIDHAQQYFNDDTQIEFQQNLEQEKNTLLTEYELFK